MSVVRVQAWRRWAVVVAGVAALSFAPTAWSAATAGIGGSSRSDTRGLTAQILVRRALASAVVPYSGLAQSTGTLGLPDLPQLGDVAAVLGGTTRTRVWWQSPQSWRVAVLSPTGEQDIYRDHGRNVLWDYEQARLTEVIGTSPVRLPRADDLLPPQAARRLLAGIGAGDHVTLLPGSRIVAGVHADGLRIVPGDERSTIGRVEIWLDRKSGLPLAFDITDRLGISAVHSEFTQLTMAKPETSALRIPSAPGAAHDSSAAPDLVARIQQFSDQRLPARLAGVAASAPIVGGTATYGPGLVRFVVLPLPGRLAYQVLNATKTGGGTELNLAGGDAVLVKSGLINLVVARRSDRHGSYLIAGPVDAELLTAAAGALLQRPAPEGFG